MWNILLTCKSIYIYWSRKQNSIDKHIDKDWRNFTWDLHNFKEELLLYYKVTISDLKFSLCSRTGIGLNRSSNWNNFNVCQVTQLNTFREISLLYHMNAFPFFVDSSNSLPCSPPVVDVVFECVFIVDIRRYCVWCGNQLATLATITTRRSLNAAALKPEIFVAWMHWIIYRARAESALGSFGLSAIIGSVSVWPIKSIRRLYQIQLVAPRNRWRQFQIQRKRLGNTLFFVCVCVCMNELGIYCASAM